MDHKLGFWLDFNYAMLVVCFIYEYNDLYLNYTSINVILMTTLQFYQIMSANQCDHYSQCSDKIKDMIKCHKF